MTIQRKFLLDVKAANLVQTKSIRYEWVSADFGPFTFGISVVFGFLKEGGSTKS